MFITEYNQEKVLAQERRDTANNERRRVATDMLRDGEPLEKIKRYSRLAEDAILRLAHSIGVTIS